MTTATAAAQRVRCILLCPSPARCVDWRDAVRCFFFSPTFFSPPRLTSRPASGGRPSRAPLQWLRPRLRYVHGRACCAGDCRLPFCPLLRPVCDNIPGFGGAWDPPLSMSPAQFVPFSSFVRQEGGGSRGGFAAPGMRWFSTLLCRSSLRGVSRVSRSAYCRQCASGLAAQRSLLSSL